MLVRRSGAVRFGCAADAATAAARNEDTTGLSDEEEAVDVRVARRLLVLVDGAGLSEGLEAVRSLVARRLRVCRCAGMSVAGSGEEDVREVADVAEEM